MATLNNVYDTSDTVTITLTSLGNGSWRQSLAVDNSVDLFIDALIGGKIMTGTSPSSGGSIDIYAYGTYDGGTTYTAGASGTDVGYTADGEEGLFIPLQSINVNTDSDRSYVWGPVSVAEAFGGTLPAEWGIVIENNTGVALNSTGSNHEIKFTGIEQTIA